MVLRHVDTDFLVGLMSETAVTWRSSLGYYDNV